MVLSKSTIPIAFTGGLDQKTPEKLVVPGKFLALENCVRRKHSGVKKRYGFSSLGKGISGGTTSIAEGFKVDNFNGDLILLDGTRLYSYSAANDNWINRGSCETASVTATSLVRNGDTQAMADVAQQSGLTVTVWEDSRGGVRYSVYDDETGAALVYDTVLDASASRPKVIAVRGGFVIGYRLSTNLKTQTIQLGTPTAISAAVTLAANVSDSPWDMTRYNDDGVFVFNNSGTSTITIGYVTRLGAAGAPGTNGFPAPVNTSGTGTAANALSIQGDEQENRLWIMYHGSAGVVRVRTYTPDLITTSEVDVETLANVRNITGALTANRRLRIFYEISAASVKDHFVKRARVAQTGTGTPTIATAAAVHMRSVGLASKAWSWNDTEYVCLSHDSALQPTYFASRVDGFIVARILGNVGGGHTRDPSGTLKSGLRRVESDATGRFNTVLQIRNKLEIESGGTTLKSNKGLQKIALDFSITNFTGATLGDNYHIAGGTLLAYDGVSVAEHGFYIFPEDLTSSSPTGGSLAAGDYSYRVIYEWTDGKGQIHRSAPSITKTELAVAANDKITIVVPTLRVTNRTATNVKIVVYVAAVGLSTVYYRHTETANTTGDTVSIDISTAPSTSAEVLYTTGGTMENIAAPAANVVHVFKNRLILGGVESNDGLYISKEHFAGEGVAVVDAVRVFIDAVGGNVTALATLDDKLVIFKADRIYVMTGEGPLDSGLQNDFTLPQLIAGDVGTSIPQSVTVIPQGVVFKSDKGVYLLNRALGLRYIGDRVDDLNGLTISSAVVLADDNEVRFTTSDGQCLVYNYYFDQWSTFTNYEAVSACNALGTYVHLKADGTVNREVVGQYHDNGVRFSMGIETSWLSFAGVQGYQRVYMISLLGDFVSHNYTKVKVAYDFEQAYTETIYHNTKTGMSSDSVYGEGDTYGDTATYGGDGSSVYQVELKPMRQKCEAIKLRIEDIDTIGQTAGGSFILVAMTAEVGRKNGVNRMKAAKVAGSL